MADVTTKIYDLGMKAFNMNGSIAKLMPRYSKPSFGSNSLRARNSLRNYMSIPASQQNPSISRLKVKIMDGLYIKKSFQFRIFNLDKLSDPIKFFLKQNPELITIVEDTIYAFSKKVNSLVPHLEVLDDPNDDHQMLFINFETKDPESLDKFIAFSENFAETHPSEVLKKIGLNLSNGI